MRFMIIRKADAETEAGAVPGEELIAAMARYNQELADAGVLVGGDGLQPSAKGARIRFTDGKPTITDGPFTEAKELIAGFALVQLPSKDAAIDLAEQFLRIAGQGSAEVREAFEPKGEPVEAGAVQAVGSTVMA